MNTFQLIDNNGGNPRAYESLLVEPAKLSIFSSKLSLQIVQELVKEPACAMDLARRLGQHEQKIYYHLRKLEEAGIIRQIRTERRFSMTAKIYGVVAPVIATKLYEDGHPVERGLNILNPRLKRFLNPFIVDGKLNAKIVAGDPYPHGKYDKPARGSVRAFDFLLLLGRFIKNHTFPHYQLDVDTREDDLKGNLIVLSSPKANTIAEKLNPKLPVYYDSASNWNIVSKLSGKTYDDARTGLILKWDNPFAKGKKVLIVSGIRSRGMQAAVIALTQHFDEVAKGTRGSNLVRIVEGYDADGDKVIDSVKFLE